MAPARQRVQAFGLREGTPAHEAETQNLRAFPKDQHRLGGGQEQRIAASAGEVPDAGVCLALVGLERERQRAGGLRRSGRGAERGREYGEQGVAWQAWHTSSLVRTGFSLIPCARRHKPPRLTSFHGPA
jgi:hypothetical protein